MAGKNVDLRLLSHWITTWCNQGIAVPAMAELVPGRNSRHC